jgi:alanyl aminopeptidase
MALHRLAPLLASLRPLRAARLALLLLASCAAERPRPPPPLAATAAPPAPPAAPEEAPPLLQLPADVRPLHATLELTVVPSADDFSGTIAIEVELTRARRVVWLHGNGLKVTSAEVEIGGARRPAAWKQVNEDGLARLDLEAPAGPGKAMLRLAWRGTWGQMEGLFHWQDRGDWYAATQLEAIDARRVFPGFDEPAFKHPWDVTLVMPEGQQVVGNGAEGASQPAGPGLRRVRLATTHPLPSYLLFLAVGPYDVVSSPVPPNEVRLTALPQRGFAPRGRGAELAFGLEAATEAVTTLERWFGIPFPYGKLDHVMQGRSPGAMENAGAISYAENELLFAPGKDPEAQRREIATTVAHEVAHQWFGDLVTLGWWTDIWLNESFATWITPRALAAWRPDWRLELDLVTDADWPMQEDGLASARAIRKPLANMAEVDGQFDAMSYGKGAAVLSMFERLAGPERFREGVRSFLKTHAHATATTPAFLAAISTAAGRDLAPAFATFLDQPGVPLVMVEVVCASTGTEARLQQAPWHPRGATAAPPSRWQVPVCLRGEVKGRPFERCTLLDSEAGVLPLPDGCPDWLLPNAAAAGYYRFRQPSRDLALLLEKGSARLTVAEKLALLGSLSAASQAGVVSPADLLAATTRLATDPDEQVVLATLPVFGQWHQILRADPALRPLAALERRLYRDRFDRLGWMPRLGEPERAGRLRSALLWHLTLVTRDPAVRAEAAQRGARFLGLGGKAPDPAAITPDLVGTAVTAAIEEHGLPALEVAWARLLASGGQERSALRLAIQVVNGPPALRQRIDALWRQPGLTPEDQLYLSLGLGLPEGAPSRLERLERERDEVLNVAPPGYARLVRYALGALQEPGDADRVRRLFEPLLEKRPELARPLAQTLERIGINVAARERRAEFAAAVGRASR